MKKIVVYLMSIMLIFSSIKIPTFASGAVMAGLGEFLKGLGYSIVWSVGSEIADEGIDSLKSWLTNDKKYYDSHESDEGNEFGGGGSRREPNYYSNNNAVNDAMQNYSLTTNKQFIDNSVTNKYTYNSFISSVTENRTYSLIKDSFNTTNNYLVYNPVTNNYTEINNISYNNQFDTYYITNNEYNYYVTNNYTYYSYYIINNETGEDSYCEVYYELPDGRNSYDLEVSDVWGEYFVYDVVGYESVKEDDGKTLALYHFNNNVSDSSYWHYNDFPLASGLFSDAKFDSGLLINCGQYNYYSFELPDSFDINNFTIEFTVINNTSKNIYSSLYVNTGGTSSTYMDSVFGNIGIHSIVIQNNSGNLSFYKNGSLQNVYTSTNRYEVGQCLPSLFFMNSDYLYFCGYYYGTYLLDELRISNCALYSGESISVMNQEFDTNQVLCLPENPYESLIAVQGSQDVSGYRIGGVRPTYPTNGYVYIYLEDDVVKDVQQFQNDGWYSVNGSIYKNGEWIDLKDYNLSSYVYEEDDYNSGGSGSNNSSGSGSDNSGGTGSGGSVSDNDTGSGSGLSGFLDGLGSLGDALLAIIGKLLEYVGKAIELLSGTVTKVIDLVPQNITNLISGLFPFIPQEWLVAIELSLVLAVVIGIVGMFKK